MYITNFGSEESVWWMLSNCIAKFAGCGCAILLSATVHFISLYSLLGISLDFFKSTVVLEYIVYCKVEKDDEEDSNSNDYKSDSS